ncbi:hypothetical protein A6U92_21110 [Agrobacterium rubi]|nr:hypothetical protein A6U92_21110 [Agrobacterium rubi]
MSKNMLRFVALPCARMTGWKACGASREVRSSLLALGDFLPTGIMDFIDGQSLTPELQRSVE